MSTEYNNVSADLVWEIVNGQNSFLVKRKQAGGVQFSRDPFNLTNKHARKYEGFVNDTAIGIQPTPADAKPGVVLKTKNADSVHQPAKAVSATTFSTGYPIRKVYTKIVDETTKKGYRSDLRAEAVARASAVKLSQREKKERPAKKARGNKAKRAALAQDE